MSARSKLAKEIFKSGHNCAQSVLISFKDILEKDEADLRSLGTGFGGGMGKLQLTCGAVTGAFMVFSMYAAEHSVDNAAAKSFSADMIQQFEKKFISLKHTINCKQLLGVDMNTEEGQKEIAEKDLFGTVCRDAIESAVEIVEEILKEV